MLVVLIVKRLKTNNNLIYIIIIVFIIIVSILFFLFNKKEEKPVYRIDLIGDKYIILDNGEEYIEPGFIAYKNNVDVSSEVVIKNEIIENTRGVYKVIYQIDDYIEYRYVEIKEAVNYSLDIKYEVNNDKITNQDIVIDIIVDGMEFDYLLLPDETISRENITSYRVGENGSYKFIAYNTKNEVFEKTIVINNIDKELPIGECHSTLNLDNTLININTTEDELIYRYYLDNELIKTLYSNQFQINNKTSDNIYVELEDKAGNISKITCQITDNRYYPQLKPQSYENIVFEGNSDTFKTYIVNKNSFYLTYIWVKDAYSQLNKYDSPEYGVKLYQPKELLTQATEKKNLNNKIMVGFNASAFYLKDRFDADSVRAYPKYDRTSVGSLVITDGKVIRNAYEYAVKTWYTIGVNKNNQLLVFEDKKTNNTSEKLAWSQNVINSGIRNTFTFAAPLIENYQKTNIITSMPGGMSDTLGLQIICQVNDNNYLLFSSRYSTRNRAVDEFMKLGCKTAMNLDGGGSVALFYKDRNSNKIINVIGGDQTIPEVGYFTE